MSLLSRLSSFALSPAESEPYRTRPILAHEVETIATWDDQADRLGVGTLHGLIVRPSCVVVGLCGLVSKRPVAYCFLRFGKQAISIRRIVVDPAYRRQGIATKLVRLIAQEYTGLVLDRAKADPGRVEEPPTTDTPYRMEACVPEDRDDWVRLFAQSGGKAALKRGLFGEVDGILFTFG